MTNNDITKTKVINKQHLTGFPMRRGFVLVGIRSVTNHPRRNVFLIEDTPDLKAAMSEYLSEMW